MGRRIATVALALLLAIVSVSCGKPDPEPEATEKKPVPFGFRVYEYNEETGTKVLYEEYENRITERSLTQYNGAGEAVSVEKWYYDSAATRLIKHVTWSKDYPTTSEEYDEKGRLIRRSEKFEEEHAKARAEGWIHLHFPKEYVYKPWGELPEGVTEWDAVDHWFNEQPELDPDIEEIVTEYTYDGDSDVIREMKTVTGRGEVIGQLQRGEGDIILKRELNWDEYTYEENYNGSTGEWWFSSAWRDALPYGTKQYGDGGVLESEIWNEDSEEGMITCVYHPDADGRSMTMVYWVRDNEVSEEWKTAATVRRSWDTDGRLIYDAAEYSDMFWGEYRSSNVLWEFSYDKDGNTVKTLFSQQRDDGIQSIDLVRTEERQDNKFLRRLTDHGKVVEEYTMELVEVPGIAGKVQHVTDYYNYGTEEKCEIYYVDLPDQYDPGETQEVQYSEITQDQGDLYEAEFDEAGILRRLVCRKSIETVTEYDERGRMVKTYSLTDPGRKESGYLYEYWEGEAE
ncbi:MAG: hypothetical protein J6Y67_02910 [Lachnospiraceae bacterium]|nr:hypothetical protein [Lachnospiraceae bacterium]